MDANIIPLHFDKIFAQKIEADWLTDKHLSLEVLRLDLLHPVISGNKWFKLQGYLTHAVTLKKDTIATFGGAFSNHILATAYACQQFGLKSLGFVRGEGDKLSHTLQQVLKLGMTLHFVTRENYRFKETIRKEHDADNIYWVNEGGYGEEGANGAAGILNYCAANRYTHLVAAVGTGTMLAGLIKAYGNFSGVIGISSMKGNFALADAVKKLLPIDKLSTPFEILHEYHFGGYGKHPLKLIDFMNEIYAEYKLPLDIIYTSKVFFAIKDLVQKKYFAPGSSILMIHSGGLQGNASLPPGLLSFL